MAAANPQVNDNAALRIFDGPRVADPRTLDHRDPNEFEARRDRRRGREKQYIEYGDGQPWFRKLMLQFASGEAEKACMLIFESQ